MTARTGQPSFLLLLVVLFVFLFHFLVGRRINIVVLWVILDSDGWCCATVWHPVVGIIVCIVLPMVYGTCILWHVVGSRIQLVQSFQCIFSFCIFRPVYPIQSILFGTTIGIANVGFGGGSSYFYPSSDTLVAFRIFPCALAKGFGFPFIDKIEAMVRNTSVTVAK